MFDIEKLDAITGFKTLTINARKLNSNWFVPLNKLNVTSADSNSAWLVRTLYKQLESKVNFTVDESRTFMVRLNAINNPLLRNFIQSVIDENNAEMLVTKYPQLIEEPIDPKVLQILNSGISANTISQITSIKLNLIDPILRYHHTATSLKNKIVMGNYISKIAIAIKQQEQYRITDIDGVEQFLGGLTLPKPLYVKAKLLLSFLVGNSEKTLRDLNRIYPDLIKEVKSNTNFKTYLIGKAFYVAV